jgi:hypothetical protein
VDVKAFDLRSVNQCWRRRKILVLTTPRDAAEVQAGVRRLVVTQS